jgi:hypothetical protein
VGILLAMLLIATQAPPSERAKLQIDTLKYGLGFFAAGSAVAAILLNTRLQLLSEHTHSLAVKTQQLSELNHALALKAQTHIENDAAERRVTDLYARAVEQLGSSDAAVRLGGLYALERVAQNHPSQRQTIINLLCAYLRMLYEPPVLLDRSSTVPDDVRPSPNCPGPSARAHSRAAAAIHSKNCRSGSPRNGSSPPMPGLRPARTTSLPAVAP